uniref:Putative acetyltransferase [Include 4 Bacterial transferase hexapeptide repeat] n=1 Tax=Magnetococcus massalia (strain MO-1) TaxID=451514 RepID=A0A1S7LM70_MAGMO|nr:Putative acetyltransferase [Include 4 Bacterial transferase hexapeptide repeat] [Candidatus Magnetococcus massalia]
MVKEQLYILGAGGHAKVVADAAQASGQWREIILLDRCSAPYAVGPWQVLPEPQDPSTLAGRGVQFICGMGDNRLRLKLQTRWEALGLAFATVIHPAGVVSPLADLGPGSFVAAGGVVNIDTTIGRCVVINTGATVDHDCQLADGCQIAPGAHLGGGVRVGEATMVGIGAVIKLGCHVGRDVTIGVGAAVVTAVPDGVIVKGVPGRW